MVITKGKASTVAQLREEISALRQRNEELGRLASFPQLNPHPIFEFNRDGEAIYLNQAAQETLARLGLADAQDFLPDDFTEMWRQVGEDKIYPFSREVTINDQVFEEIMYYAPEYASFRIYPYNITHRRKVEADLDHSRQELRHTQDLLEAVTAGTDVIIASVDDNFRYTYFNQAYKDEVRRLSGTEIQLGMNILDAFAHLPELQEIVRGEWSEVLSGKSTNKILDFGDPGYYQRSYNVLHTPIWNAEGVVVGAGEVAYNISAQVHAQEALRESEARYRSLFEGMSEGFAIHEMIYDENGNPYDYRFLDINPAFERLTGLKREQAIGKTYREILPGEGDKWINVYGEVVLTGEPVQFEDYAPSLAKHYEIFAYRYASGQFAVIFVDISARKQIEEELRVNLTKYSVLFETLPLGVTISDDNGRILESNQEATRLLGLSDEEQKRRLINGEEWKVIRLDKTIMPMDEYASVRALKEQRRVENVEMGIVKNRGQITWISVTAAPIPLKNHGVVITYNDISQRIRAEEALREGHEKLEATVHQRTKELRRQTKAVEDQRQRFNDVLEILPAYLILLTPDYKVAFANRYFRERFGEDHGRRCYEYLFNRNEPCETCESYKVLRTGTSHHWEWVGPDERNYDVFDYPFKDVDGSTLILEMGIDITMRKRAEDKLKSLNAYNRSLIEANLDALVTITPEGKIGDVNTVSEAITGYSRHILVGTDFSSYFTDPDKARLGYEQVFETGTVRDYELEIQHKDGHTTPVVYNASVFRDESGNVAGVFAAARDITERKQSQQQLVLLNTALEAAANGVVLVNKDGTIIWSNPAFSQMTGYSREEIFGQNPRILKSGEQDQDFYHNLWDTILSGEVWRGEIINKNKDGSLYTEEQTITPVFDRSGSITNFISIRQDITDHKQSEEALRKSEEQYRSLVIASAQIVWQTNAEGAVVEDNPIWRAFTGQSQEELMGGGWISALHPADQERVADIWSKSVAAKTPYETEYRIRSVSGEYRDFIVRGVPIIGKSGEIHSWIGTCTDITEKKSYENQLVQAEKHAAIGRMVGSVTHEINNPLQTIKNCLYLIQQDTSPDSPNKEPLDMALSETQRLSNIVGQLRQLYRPQSIQAMHAQDLVKLIEEVHALIIPHLNNAHVSWQVSPNLQNCSINCIKEQMIEVLLNISINAIEAMQPDGGVLSVDFVYSDTKEQVGIIIRDTGPGISPEILLHIFEPFRTTKEFGLGLGLSICYNIVQKHGGQITIESQPSQGTSFTIWLPAVSETTD